ncbi:MAG: HAD hydrolase-like protein, partial [Ornithinimicrobium sp.]
MTVLTQTFAAALFDNDGTLIDSTEAVRRSWGSWAIEYGVDPHHLQGFHGVPAAAIVAQLLPDSDHEAALARIVALEEADT